MSSCCEAKSCALELLRAEHRRVLTIVLWINLAMFLVEFSAGIWADSSALLADSLDMFGDAIVYGFSLYVLARSASWKAGAALTKGIIQALFGLGVLIEAAGKVLLGSAPLPFWMAFIGGIALLANLLCYRLLTRHRDHDLNMRSVWLCSRNDLFANSGVLVAAALVAVVDAPWPDIVVGLLIAGLFFKTSVHVITAAVKELKHHRTSTSSNDPS